MEVLDLITATLVRVFLCSLKLIIRREKCDFNPNSYLLCTIVTVFFSPVFSGFFLTPFLTEEIPLGIDVFGLALRMELTRGEL